MPTISFKSPWLVLLAILTFALCVRVAGIEREGFWYDETCSVLFSSGSVKDILEENAKDVHPPLYHLGLSVWRRVMGERDGAIRGYSVFWSLLGIAGAFLLARDMSGDVRAGAVAALLMAVNPCDVYFAQEARMYSQAMATGVFSSWFLWRWIAPGRSGVWTWGVAYCLAAIVLLHTHYLGVFLLLSQGVFSILFFWRARRWESLVGYGFCALATSLLFLPWMKYVLQFRDSLYRADLDWIPMPGPQDVGLFLFREFYMGSSSSELRYGHFFILLSIPLTLFILREGVRLHGEMRSGGAKSSSVLYAATLLFVPGLLGVIVSYLYKPVFYRPRFCILVLPYFMILAGLIFSGLSRKSEGRGWRYWLAAMVVLMSLGVAGQTILLEKVDMREFARTWRQKGPPFVILFKPFYEARTAAYYLKGPMPVAQREQIEEEAAGGAKIEVWLCCSGEALEEDRQWLSALGRVRVITQKGNLTVLGVRTGEFENPAIKISPRE